MATRSLLVDDLDKTSEAAETVRFALDDIRYEIDLTAEHAAELREVLRRYTREARRTGGKRTSRIASATKESTLSPSSATLRAWAASNGVAVSATGRIPRSVLEAYQAAQG